MHWWCCIPRREDGNTREETIACLKNKNVQTSACSQEFQVGKTDCVSKQVPNASVGAVQSSTSSPTSIRTPVDDCCQQHNDANANSPHSTSLTPEKKLLVFDDEVLDKRYFLFLKDKDGDISDHHSEEYLGTSTSETEEEIDAPLRTVVDPAILRRICSVPLRGTARDEFLDNYRDFKERRSNRLSDRLDENTEEAALKRMRGSVIRAHSSMSFHF